MWHSVLFAMALTLVGLSAGLAGPPVGKEAAEREPLADWPADAPIKLLPRLKPAALDQQAVEAKARQYLGIDEAKKLRLVPAYLTDDDFPFLRPQKRAIWLAEPPSVQIPALEGRPVTFPHLYLAIDAETGQLIEAFTPATKPWWREKKQVIGPAHEKFFRETQQILERPIDSPKLSVTDALRGLASEADEQIVVRYGLYSNRGQAPAVQHRPALLIFREGLRIRTALGGEVIGRSVVVLDAQTGTVLSNQSYGNPKD